MISFFIKVIEFSCGICSLTIGGRGITMNNEMFPCSETVFENCLVKKISQDVQKS